MATITKRKTADGQLRYRAQVRLNGTNLSETFTRKTDARIWAEQTEGDIRSGRFKTLEAQKHTVTEAIDRYIETVLPEKKEWTQRSQKIQLDWWKSHIGNKLLSDVNAAVITHCKDKLHAGKTRLGRGRGPATITRYMAVLSHLFTVARKDWSWVDSNPFSDVSRPREPRGRVRFLDDDERERLLKACRESTNDMLYPVTLLAISTGMRQGEIMGLRWPDVDFDKGRIILEDTKNNDRRAVPLAGLAHNVLAEYKRTHRRVDTDLLFPGKNPKKPMHLRTPWTSALKRAGIENYRFHDNRHTAASYLVMNGATLAEVAEVLGHRTLAMTRRYAHMSDSHVSGVVERMNAKIFGTETR